MTSVTGFGQEGLPAARPSRPHCYATACHTGKSTSSNRGQASVERQQRAGDSAGEQHPHPHDGVAPGPAGNSPIPSAITAEPMNPPANPAKMFASACRRHGPAVDPDRGIHRADEAAMVTMAAASIAHSSWRCSVEWVERERRTGSPPARCGNRRDLPIRSISGTIAASNAGQHAASYHEQAVAARVMDASPGSGHLTAFSRHRASEGNIPSASASLVQAFNVVPQMAGLMIAAELTQRGLVQLMQHLAQHLVSDSSREILPVNAQRADQRVSVFAADFAILVAMAMVGNLLCSCCPPLVNG